MNYTPWTNLYGFGKEPGDVLARGQAGLSGVLEHLLQLFQIPFLRLALSSGTVAVPPQDLHGGVPALVTAVNAPVGVGIHDVVDVHVDAGKLVLPGALSGDAHGGHAHAVVGVAEGEELVVAGVEARHHHGHVVGLGPAVHEVDALERLGQLLGEALGVLVDLWVHVDVGRVPQSVQLVSQGRAHPRMAVTNADGDNSSEKIKVPKRHRRTT